MLVSPLCVSGGCVNSRIIGVSPEAPTLEVALGDKKPEVVVATKKDLQESYEKLNDATSREVDMVVFGCPHLTLSEVGQLASLLEGKKVSENVVLVVGFSRTSYALAKDCGYAQTIESAGGIFVNSCVGPMNPYMYLDDGAKVAAATNSVRAAHYLQRLSGGNTKTYYGEMSKCTQAAIKGKWED